MTGLHPQAAVTFKVVSASRLSESVYLLGNVGELRSWSVEEAIKLRSVKGPSEHCVWETDKLLLPSNTPIEYKFFKKNSEGDVVWEWDEERSNRVIEVNSGATVEVTQTFGMPSEEIKPIKKMKFVEDNAVSGKEDSLSDFVMSGYLASPAVTPPITE